MSKHLAAAEAAFRSGRAEEGLGHLLEALEEDEGRPASVYRALLVQLYRSGRTGEGEAWSARAVARHAGDGELWNMRGVFLRQLRRHPEALKAFETAIRLRPSQAGPQVNRGNVLLDMGDGPGAEAAFSKLVRSDPRNAELQRLLGRALQMQGRTDAAMARWRQAVALAPGSVDAWLDMAGTLMEDHRERQAHEVLDRAFRANPDDPR
ncbi:MAG: tetratricopeptide repeat protein, partial [Alphaproteobacteria bacterium]|nr:tetratricopeptide repeat protein [Alphaproteobacteria bacterium]